MTDRGKDARTRSHSPRPVTIGGCTLHQGDCCDALPKLRLIADAIITDPPYGLTDNTWDQAVDLARWWEHALPRLKPSGVAAVFSQQPLTTDLIASARKLWRYELIWEKNRAVGFLDASYKPLRAHEHIQIFSQSIKSSTYNPQKTSGKPYNGRNHPSRASSNWDIRGAFHGGSNCGQRYPRSVLRFDIVARTNGHSTQKPVDLMKWLVATYTHPGELVIDPFMGAGSTGVACVQLGRRFIGIEREPRFFRIACRRIREAQRAQARESA